MSRDVHKRIPGASQKSVLGAVILLIVVVVVGALTERRAPEHSTATRKPKAVVPTNAFQEPASMRSEPKPESRRAAIDAQRTAARESGPSATPGIADASLPSAIDAPHRSHSMFVNSPGYVPPDDPESLSVVTGRRDAPPIDMEVAGGARSPEALARLLLEALQVGDEHALLALRLTREEFGTILWPEIPESRLITHITADDAWDAYVLQSRSGVTRTVSSYGSHRLELVRVETSGPVPYRNFSLLRHVVLVCTDHSTGDEVRLKFAPSFLERHGRYKVVTFRD